LNTLDEPVSRFVRTRPPNPNVGSQAAFEKAQTWLSQCVRNHQKCCPREGIRELPTRVLEIVSADSTEGYKLRLLETPRGEDLPYAALSYVWGPPSGQYRTVVRNFHAHLEDIPVQRLPRTIADAVHCTHQLGLMHLWVDSLCIIQDSDADKDKEIQKMSAIYRNAHLTISAAKVTGSNEGFLDRRLRCADAIRRSFQVPMLVPRDTSLVTTRGLRPGEFYAGTAPWNAPNMWEDSPSTIRLAAGPLGTTDSTDLLTPREMREEPISKRGWTLQEYLLSDRVLVYGHDQLQWICLSATEVDGGIKPSSWDVDHDLCSVLRTTTSGDQVTEIYDNWIEVVQMFSHRRLGDASDKLNAIEGLAQEFRRRLTGDEYLAGLWRHDLARGLSWRQDGSVEEFGAALWNRSRQCPSWSWIKVDGPVDFCFAENLTASALRAEMFFNKIEGKYPRSRLQVSGALVVKAKISRMTAAQLMPRFRVVGPTSRASGFANYLYLDGGWTNPEFTGGAGANGRTQLSGPVNLRLMELSWGYDGGRQNLAAESRGLIIVPVPNRPDVYIRTGFYEVALEYDEEWERGRELYSCLVAPQERNPQPTRFGEEFKASLNDEIITLV